MTRDAIRSALIEELRQLAPELDPDVLAPATRLREELDLDSFDFLRLVVALDHRLGVQIPETDYAQLETLGGCVDYLSARLGEAPGASPG